MQHRLLVASAFLYLTVSNLIWAAWDTRPPFWDMAFHQTAALQILNAVSERGLSGLVALGYATGYYPPLFHSIVALAYAVFGVSTDTAHLANVPATAILMWATYRIGERVASPMSGAMAAVLVSFYPLMVWLSREALIDYWLTAMVALAFSLLLETDGFENRGKSILFGVVCGLGMLTKWTFAGFLLLPTVWFAWRRIRNGLLSVAVAGGVASLWYGPRLGTLREFFALNTAGGIAEGDPGRLSWQALVFYVRALEGYQLFLPLFLLFLGGLAWTLRNFHKQWIPVYLWIGGSWACLMLFQNKDPRYSVPILPAIAIVTAALLGSLWARTDTFVAGRRRHWIPVALGCFLLFQHYMISFGVAALPRQVVIADGVDGPLRWDWYLYSQHYFDLWDAPAREDWRIDYVLDRVSPGGTAEPVRLGIIPDIPRFDWMAFGFYALARHSAVEVERMVDPDPVRIRDHDYILMSEMAQGYGGATRPEADLINRHILERPGEFRMEDRFELPNGEMIRLYRVVAPPGAAARPHVPGSEERFLSIRPSSDAGTSARAPLPICGVEHRGYDPTACDIPTVANATGRQRPVRWSTV